jgi:hypothetical protein
MSKIVPQSTEYLYIGLDLARSPVPAGLSRLGRGGGAELPQFRIPATAEHGVDLTRLEPVPMPWMRPQRASADVPGWRRKPLSCRV